jgi:hypothetical protein
LLALAVGDGNAVLLADLQTPGRAVAISAELALAPRVRAPILVDLAFAHDGRTLWVLAGSTAQSHPLGPQPTEIHALRVGAGRAGGVSLDLARSMLLPGAGAPAALAATRSLPLASGAAIRVPPEKAAVFVVAGRAGDERAATSRALFAVSADDVRSIEGIEATWSLGLVDLTPEGRWLLAPTRGPGGERRLIGLRVDGRPASPLVLPLPARSGGTDGLEVKVQP